jgi:hypothetical protein
VGATRRSLTIACALVLALVPAAAGARRDLTVTVSRLSVPKKITSGSDVGFGVRYVVRGPRGRRGMARVGVLLLG